MYVGGQGGTAGRLCMYTGQPVCTWHLPPCHDHQGTAHTPGPADPGFPGLCVQTGWWVPVWKKTPSSLTAPHTPTFTPARLPLTVACPSIPPLPRLLPLIRMVSPQPSSYPFFKDQSKTLLLQEAHQFSLASAHFPHHPFCASFLTTHCL